MSSGFRGVKQPAGAWRGESVCAVGNGREAHTLSVISAGKEASEFDGPANPYRNVLCKSQGVPRNLLDLQGLVAGEARLESVVETLRPVRRDSLGSEHHAHY